MEEAEETRYALQYRSEGENFVAKGVEKQKELAREQKAYARKLREQASTRKLQNRHVRHRSRCVACTSKMSCFPSDNECAEVIFCWLVVCCSHIIHFGVESLFIHCMPNTNICIIHEKKGSMVFTKSPTSYQQDSNQTVSSINGMRARPST